MEASSSSISNQAVSDTLPRSLCICSFARGENGGWQENQEEKVDGDIRATRTRGRQQNCAGSTRG